MSANSISSLKFSVTSTQEADTWKGSSGATCWLLPPEDGGWFPGWPDLNTQFLPDLAYYLVECP